MVSIIVPVYNVESYLEEAVKSVLSQTVGDWELLLVDDGSTDGSGAMCDKYAKSDSRIRVYHRSNGGLSAARNTGLDNCKGDWIAFFDSDDVLHPRFIETLLAAASVTDADIVDSKMKRFEESHCTFDGPAAGEVTIYDPREAIEKALYQTGALHHSAWAKIYRSSLWQDTRFLEGCAYEDLEVMSRLWPKAGKIAAVDAELYGYRQRPGSILHTFGVRRMDVLKVTEAMENQLQKEEDAELLKAARDRRLSANFNIFLLSEAARRRGGVGHVAIDKIQDYCYQSIKERRRETLFSRKTRMRNKVGALVSYLGPDVLRKLYKFL